MRNPTGDLYNGALSRVVLFMMALVLATNVIATGICMAAGIADILNDSLETYYTGGNHYYYMSSSAGMKAGIFFYWALIPIIISSYSIAELTQFKLRKLRPIQTIIMAPIIIFTWILEMSLFSGCVYPHWHYWIIPTNICPVPEPFASNIDYNWRYVQPYAAIFIILPLIAYGVYLYFAVLAFRRRRSMSGYNSNAKAIDLSPVERSWPTPEPTTHHCAGCNCHKYVPTQQVLDAKEYDASTLGSGASSPTFVESNPQRFTSQKSMVSGRTRGTVQSFSTVMTPRDTEPPSYRNSAVLYEEIGRPHGKR